MLNVECSMLNGRTAAQRSPLSTFNIQHSTFLALFVLCFACSIRPTQQDRLKFWGLGREGEVVAQLMPEFERRTGIRVDVQQIPWTAAHEKLLTAYVGEVTPDLAQMGNTWIPEFHAVGALEGLTPWLQRSTTIQERDHFPGIWATNVVDDVVYGVPWYVDTRIMFYRSDLIPKAPRTWAE